MKLQAVSKNVKKDFRSKSKSIRSVSKIKKLHASPTYPLFHVLLHLSLRAKKTFSRDYQHNKADIQKQYISSRRIILLVFSKRKYKRLKLKFLKHVNVFIRITKGEKTESFKSNFASLVTVTMNFHLNRRS